MINLVRTISYLPAARKALRKHRVDAERIRRKIAAYASDPAGQANNVKRMKGERRAILRLRVGDFRVLIVEEDDRIVIVDIGPRGGIYD
jgi:mRNA interferase RelE/StbE